MFLARYDIENLSTIVLWNYMVLLADFVLYNRGYIQLLFFCCVGIAEVVE
jgi:hypothetical protein